ncbi:hypothetical protein BST61_g2599 [Cercospora zeina]
MASPSPWRVLKLQLIGPPALQRTSTGRYNDDIPEWTDALSSRCRYTFTAAQTASLAQLSVSLMTATSKVAIDTSVHIYKPFMFSLAGPPAQQSGDEDDRNETYYDDDYYAANPWMETEEPQNESFSLARTFPHKVRWSPKTPKKRQHPYHVPAEEKGEAEAAPQVPAAEQQAEEASGHRRSSKEGKRDPRDPRPDYFETEASSLEEIQEQPTNEDDDTQSLRPSESKSARVQERTYSHYDSKGKHRGILAKEAIADDLDPQDRPFNYWALIRLHLQRPLAEWLGVTVYVFLAVTVNLNVLTSGKSIGDTNSTYWTTGFAFMLAIYIAGGGSGAFLNPALTIMLSVFRGFPARRVPIYIFVQILGAYTGAILAFAICRDNILHLDGALVAESTGSAFYTQPEDWISNSTAFLTEMLGAAIFGLATLALGDSHNSPPGAGMHAFIFGLLATTVSMSLSYSTGGFFNPARDLGPRLAAISVGYSTDIFAIRHHWWLWGPWGAGIPGALLGGLVYDLCVFKGGESPVNYSFGRWQIERLKQEAGLAHMLGLHGRTKIIESKLESGEFDNAPKV